MPHTNLQEFAFTNYKGRTPVTLLVSSLIFLLTIFITIFVCTEYSLNRWQRGNCNRITIEIPHIDDAVQQQEVMHKVQAILDKAPWITNWEELNQDQLFNILQSWIGSESLSYDLPMPILIDADITPGGLDNIELLIQQLRTVAAGIVVESHNRWQQILGNMQGLIKTFLHIILFILISIISVLIAIITSELLAIHRPTIETLRFLGATNNYIARQFQNYLIKISFKGSIFGILIAAPTILLIRYILQSGGMPPSMLEIPYLELMVILGLIPFFCCLLCGLMAKITVFQFLLKFEER